MISLEKLFQRAVDVVEKTGIRYLVYGGVALPAWGDVITTQDLDLLVQVDEASATQLIAAYRDAGFHLRDDAEALFPIDTWTRASLGGRDVDIAWGATEFDEAALSRAVSVTLYNRTVPIASAEDLIL